MKGHNTMILNEATMIEVVQKYLNSMMVGSVPAVTSVKAVSANGDNTFKVELDGGIAQSLADDTVTRGVKPFDPSRANPF